MPTAPQRPCLQPGCPALVSAGQGGYCDKHKRAPQVARQYYDTHTRVSTPALAFAKQVRDSGRWQCVREMHKAQKPLCCDPFGTHAREGMPACTEQSHHIISLAAIYAMGPAHYELAYDLANLAPLCTRCHRRVEAMERAGKETAGLFVGLNGADHARPLGAVACGRLFEEPAGKPSADSKLHKSAE